MSEQDKREAPNGCSAMIKRTYSVDECDRFAFAADPYRWLELANDLHRQAIVVRERRGGGGMIYSADRRRMIEQDAGSRATFLLASLALENAIKAFLVFEHPGWVAHGFLSPEMRTHGLIALSEKSTLIPNVAGSRNLLALLDSGNKSWMRYPCGLSIDSIEPACSMRDKIWKSYLRTMRAYGRKLFRLLTKVGWDHPSRGRATWKLSGTWLESA